MGKSVSMPKKISLQWIFVYNTVQREKQEIKKMHSFCSSLLVVS